MKIRLLLTLVGLAISFALPTFAQQKEPTPSESTPEATPTPTLGDHFTQVLPDRRVTFRLLAPKANARGSRYWHQERCLRTSRDHDHRDDEGCERPLDRHVGPL